MLGRRNTPSPTLSFVSVTSDVSVLPAGAAAGSASSATLRGAPTGRTRRLSTTDGESDADDASLEDEADGAEASVSGDLQERIRRVRAPGTTSVRGCMG